MKLVRMRLAAALLTALSASASPFAGAADPLELSIEVDEPAYDLDRARLGDVTVIARVRNPGGEAVLLAHPNVCFPHELLEGKAVTPEQSESHLAVEIVAPSGSRRRLVNNLLRLFAPGNRDHLDLGPGAAAEFRLGWFAPEYNLGQWEIDQPVFTESGTYRVTLRYHNAYPVAHVFGAGETRSRPMTAWTGTLQSNTVEIRIE